MKNYYTRKFLMLFVIATVAATGAFAQVPELSVYYKFDETDGTVATDETTNSYNGEITDTSATWVDGKYGGALQLSGAGLVSLPAETMGVFSSVGSAAFWIKMDNVTKIRAIFSMAAKNADDEYTDGMGKQAYDLHIHTEQPGGPWIGGELCIRSQMTPDPDGTAIHLIADEDQELGTYPTDSTSDALVGDDEWHHVVGTWETGKISLYLDGKLMQTGAYSPSAVPVTRIQLGSFGTASRRFIGAIDEFRFYSYALSADDITKLYEDPFAEEPNSISNIHQDGNNFSAIVKASTVQFLYNADENLNVNISVFDLTGRKLNSVDRIASAGNNTVEMNTSLFGQGIYIAKIQYSNGKSLSTKFMTK